MKAIAQMLLFVCTAASAVAIEPIFANREAGEYAGKPYVIAIDRNRIIALPRWKPEEGEPKISPGEAWKRARAGLKKLIPDIERFETTAISLQHVGSNDGTRFVYIVNFVDWDSLGPKANESGIYPMDQLSVWVATDGTVFLPRPSKGKGDEFVF